MGNQLSRVFEIGIGAFGLVLAISLFIVLNVQSSNLIDERYTRNRLYTERNTYNEYNNMISGGEVIYKIIDDANSTIFTIKDNAGTIFNVVTDCSDINSLSMINKNKQYLVSYTFESGKIKGITYKEIS